MLMSCVFTVIKHITSATVQMMSSIPILPKIWTSNLQDMNLLLERQ